MPVFDSRNEKYKAPFGAVVCGTEVRFFVEAEKEFSACTLLCFGEFADSHTETLLSPCEGGFVGVYAAPAEPELVWYSFRLTRAGGEMVYFGRNGCCEGCTPWQLTVYEDTATPAWFGEGVTYQIYPDRFCRSKLPRVDGLLGERRAHLDWNAAPHIGADPETGRWNSDFFGGDLQGVISKLDYLHRLGVDTIYFNPIFEAASNHRYDTADYCTIDPLLGTEEDFAHLCREAKKRGIRVMLDGVFNHTGDDSRYFNRSGFYETAGAYQSPDSPYYSWYNFFRWPDEYDGWWGIKTLPAVNEYDPRYREFIITGEDSVIRRWLRLGASGWRLDVADELPDDFIVDIRRVMEEENPEAFLLGEVWEDGSNKIAYSRRRRYLLGRETHGLMNYPLRTALLHYLRGGDAAHFREAMETVRENYPRPAFYSGLNILGTHDTPRILTALGEEGVPSEKADRAAYRLSPEQRSRARARLKMAAMVLFAFPGSPTVYYGDEAGMEGFEDPMNRRTFPWGREDTELQGHFSALAALRHTRPSLQRGDLRYIGADGAILVFERILDGERTVVALNAGNAEWEIELPWDTATATELLSGQRFWVRSGRLKITLPPESGVLLG
ncbi:MAG: alpha-glucosidase C-terminal domain-containing protein [Oscillospiraceae bacterium]|nr:alpha-glucosidase C-terminal domain-containing protein [Oscillospiraceae bacterium]